jgi:hypothetical protein
VKLWKAQSRCTGDTARQSQIKNKPGKIISHACEGDSRPMNTTQNRAVVTAYFDAFNRGDIDEVCGLFSPDAARGGLDKARPIWEELFRCFRMSSRVEAMVAEGDSVAVRLI